LISRSFFLSLFLSVFLSTIATAGNLQMIIELISRDIEQTRDAKKKSMLHIFRARQYTKIKKLEMALEDYNEALELDHKGWIHLERSQFLLVTGNYELAYEDANAAKEEVPTLAPAADKVIEKAVAAIRKQFESDNPITIVMDTKVDPYRKTRFDLMREQGLGLYTSRSSGSSGFGRTRASSKIKSKTACAPKGKS